LFRLAVVDRLLLACKESNIQKVTKIRYEAPSVIAPPEIKGDPKDPKSDAKFDPKGDSKKDAKNAATAEIQDKLIQFPVRITLVGPERAVAQLLFEVQKPTADSIHGYFCLNSVKVEINDTVSGTVKATLGVSALLSETLVNAMQIKLKSADEDRKGGSSTHTEKDPDRY
jgi:hypothetical protein